MGIIAVTALLLALWFAVLGVSMAAAAPAWNYGSEEPPDGAVVATTTVMMQATVSDTVPIDIARTLMTVNGASVTPLTEPAGDGVTWIVSYRASGLQPGPNIVEMVSWNTMGEASGVYAFTIYVDLPPVITTFTPADGSYLTNSLTQTVRVTLTDLDVYGAPVLFASLAVPTLQVNGGFPTAMTRDSVGQTFFRTRLFSSSDVPVPLIVTAYNQSPSPGSTTATHYVVITSQADATPPVIDLASLTPAPGTTVAPPPKLQVWATDNRPGTLTVGFIVDGVAKPTQTAAQGTVAWTPSPDLADGSHDVTVTAVDAAGNAAIPRTWSFTVASGTTASHETTTDFATCSRCHSPVLTTEHDNHGFDCVACHGSSSSQKVRDAIRDNDTACDACHDLTVAGGHTALHEGGLPSGGGCNECHKSNITAEHEDECAVCHSRTDARVIAAISAGNAKCASCHTPGFHAAGFFSNKTDYYAWTTTPGPRESGAALGEIGSNPANPGAHANYLATTAKCGMCHSVHRAAGNGAKLLPTAEATCAGCHTGGTAITAKIVTVAAVNRDFVADGSTGPAGGGGGPHNDCAQDLIDDGKWDGVGVAPAPGFEPVDNRYGCFTRRCHATNPHGANSSKYTLFASKLLFNNSPAQDDAEAGVAVGTGTYGGLDAAYDNLGATDAAVQRFADANPGIITLSSSKILVNGVEVTSGPNARALVSGMTCGRPSNVPSGEDECHAEAAYAIVDKGIVEDRNKATGLTKAPFGSPLRDGGYTTDNTGAEYVGFGGNDSRAPKTGHVAGSFAAIPDNGSYAPIAGCTSCHDQTDSANTVAGNFTFPHGQTPLGISNLTTDGLTSATGVRSRIWAGISGSVGATMMVTPGTPEKAYDGQCLKCHRDLAGNGIGLTK